MIGVHKSMHGTEKLVFSLIHSVRPRPQSLRLNEGRSEMAEGNISHIALLNFCTSHTVVSSAITASYVLFHVMDRSSTILLRFCLFTGSLVENFECNSPAYLENARLGRMLSPVIFYPAVGTTTCNRSKGECIFLEQKITY